MNIEHRCKEIKRNLLDTKTDCETLLKRLNSALVDINGVTDEESAKAFDDKYSGIENGLKHIELF